MEKIYEPIGWEDFPSEKTPISSENLGKMDLAINEIDSRVVEHEHNKLSKTDASSEYANAIKRTYSGETIVATDSSGVHLEGLRVLGRSEQVSTTGKNLLENKATSNANNGVTFTVNDDGSVTVNGTAANTTYFAINEFEYGDGTYILNGTPSGGGQESYCVYDDVLRKFDSGQGVEIEGKQKGKIYIRILSGVTLSNVTLYPMIRLASIADDTYEPYTGGKASPSVEYPQPIESVGDDGSVDVGVYGKNLIELENGKNVTVDGINIMIDNGKITVKGTPTNTTGYTRISVGTVCQNDAGIYTSSMIGKITGIGFTYSTAHSLNITMAQSSNKTTSTLTSDIIEQKVTLNVSNELGTVDWEGYIQLEKGSEATEYEPYTKQSLSVSTLNGLPAIKVTDASLATYTDENGVMWCADEIDFARMKYLRRIVQYEVQSNHLSAWVDSGVNLGVLIDDLPYNTNPTILNGYLGYCTHFLIMKNAPAKVGYLGVRSNGDYYRFYIRNTEELTTLEEWEMFFDSQYANGNPVTIVMIAPEPIEVPLSTSEIEAYKALRSNYPTTVIMNDEGAFTEVTLVADTKNHIEQNYVPKSEFLSVVDRVSALEQKALA